MDIDVDHVARLARLALSADEAVRLKAELAQIVAHFSTLDAVDTEGVPATTHAVPTAPPLREDVVTGALTREEALAGAAEHDGEAFVVPQVVG